MDKIYECGNLHVNVDDDVWTKQAGLLWPFFYHIYSFKYFSRRELDEMQNETRISLLPYVYSRLYTEDTLSAFVYTHCIFFCIRFLLYCPPTEILKLCDLQTSN